MLDLFGNDTPYPTGRQSFSDKKAYMKYRKSDDPNRKCKFCKHLVKKSYSKVYYNCDLISLGNSEASDIRVNHVCDHFEKS